MHELSICQGLLKQVSQIAAENHATAINNIYLQLGPLAGVEGALLQAAFPIARQGTLAEQASLYIRVLPIRVRCKTCHAESEVETNNLTCALCGDWKTELISGDELLIERVELKTRQQIEQQKQEH